MYKVVIIDDEKWVIRSLCATLTTQENFEIISEAYNGLEGLKLIQTKKPDLAFVDIRMPGMGGLDLIQQANEQNLPTLFIIISGHAEFAYAQKAMFHNAIGYCLKPFSASEINDILNKACLLLAQRIQNQLYLSSNSATLEVAKTYLDSPPPSSCNKVICIMLDYIHSNFYKDIPIQKLADLCNINSNYASQLFSQEVGENYSSYLTKLRINYSLKLLKSTDLTISEISEKVGYKDYFYFAKVFKKIVGITPTTFRMEGRYL